jgi:hypothetical protein
MDLRPVWLALPLIAACASTTDWSKPGATEAQIDGDFRACSATAENVPVVPRQQTIAPSGAANYSTGSDLGADHQFVVAQRVERCMRERGYERVKK